MSFLSSAHLAVGAAARVREVLAAARGPGGPGGPRRRVLGLGFAHDVGEGLQIVFRGFLIVWCE